MRKVLPVLLLLSFALCGGCIPGGKITVYNPLDSFLGGNGEGVVNLHLARIALDCNNDGLEDILLACGVGGVQPCGDWALYLADERRNYVFLGYLRLNLSDVCIEPLHRGTTRITTWLSGSGNTINRVEYILSGRKLRKTKDEAAASGGTMARGKVQYDLFGKKMEVCLLAEYVKTRNCLWKRVSLSP